MGERTAEEWGRLAVSLPGWRWMPGMLGQTEYGGTDRIMDYTEASQPNVDVLPDPDDPATEGCLFRLLGWPHARLVGAVGGRPAYAVTALGGDNLTMGKGRAWGLGRALIAAAAAIGHWPGTA